MKVDQLKQYTRKYLKFLSTTAEPEFFFKWKCQENFLSHWNLSAEDFAQVYDMSLQSPVSHRLWGGSKFSGKSGMLHLIQFDQAFTKSMFRDLFNEKSDANGRISRFLYHCDELSRQLKKADPQFIAHHQDEALVSLYLSFSYPQEHCIFEVEKFAQASKHLGIKSAPQNFEYDRFLRLVKAMRTIMHSIEEVHTQYPFDIGLNLLLVHDFYEWLAKYGSRPN